MTVRHIGLVAAGLPFFFAAEQRASAFARSLLPAALLLLLNAEAVGTPAVCCALSVLYTAVWAAQLLVHFEFGALSYCVLLLHYALQFGLPYRQRQPAGLFHRDALWRELTMPAQTLLLKHHFRRPSVAWPAYVAVSCGLCAWYFAAQELASAARPRVAAETCSEKAVVALSLSYVRFQKFRFSLFQGFDSLEKLGFALRDYRSVKGGELVLQFVFVFATLCLIVFRGQQEALALVDRSDWSLFAVLGSSPLTRLAFGYRAGIQASLLLAVALLALRAVLAESGAGAPYAGMIELALCFRFPELCFAALALGPFSELDIAKHTARNLTLSTLAVLPLILVHRRTGCFELADESRRGLRLSLTAVSLLALLLLALLGTQSARRAAPKLRHCTSTLSDDWWVPPRPYVSEDEEPLLGRALP